jgi:hypothetical protein
MRSLPFHVQEVRPGDYRITRSPLLWDTDAEEPRGTAHAVSIPFAISSEHVGERCHGGSLERGQDVTTPSCIGSGGPR